MTYRDHVPWKGVKVLVIKPGEQRKGEPAVVDDVLCNQSDMASRLKINIQFINYNPNMPFQKALFDYDDIVEFEYVQSTIFVS